MQLTSQEIVNQYGEQNCFKYQHECYALDLNSEVPKVAFFTLARCGSLWLPTDEPSDDCMDMGAFDAAFELNAMTLNKLTDDRVTEPEIGHTIKGSCPTVDSRYGKVTYLTPRAI
ncbi:hypothetical protein RCJ22_15620 [Vibrio sp. FNV 38]|nr:hypothetical protein [Vibrio sp. FNV 38]